MAATAPTTGTQKRVPSGKRTMPMRMTPKAPSFMSTPACSIDTAVGADACPSGDQVWKGNTPARVPKPSQISGKAITWSERGYFAAARSPRSKLVPPAER